MLRSRPPYWNIAGKDPFCLGRGPDILGRLHPRRDVALAVEHAPDIDVVRALDVKHQMRVAGQWPDTQAQQIEFVRVTRRARAKVATDMGVGLLQRVDETLCCLLCSLIQVIGNGLVNVPVGLLTRNDCLGLHP